MEQDEKKNLVAVLISQILCALQVHKWCIMYCLIMKNIMVGYGNLGYNITRDLHIHRILYILNMKNSKVTSLFLINTLIFLCSHNLLSINLKWQCQIEAFFSDVFQNHIQYLLLSGTVSETFHSRIEWEYLLVLLYTD